MVGPHPVSYTHLTDIHVLLVHLIPNVSLIISCDFLSRKAEADHRKGETFGVMLSTVRGYQRKMLLLKFLSRRYTNGNVKPLITVDFGSNTLQYLLKLH